MKLKLNFKWLALMGLAFLLVACGQEPQTVRLAGKTMGTDYHITYVNDGSVSNLPSPKDVQAAIDARLREVNNQMSTYQKDSELSLFNKDKQVNTPIKISPEFARVVKEAIRLNKVTDGALDITVGPLVNLWGFGPEKRPIRTPTAAELQQRLAWTGINKLTFSEQDGQATLSKSIPQLYVDSSSIAKGFGVDYVAEYLSSLGLNNYLVEIGGEVRTHGVNIKGNPWQIAIEKPEFDGSRAVEQIVGLTNMAMATSGNYRNYFEENGIRYTHEINPKTGMTIQHHLASISVLSPSCMTADGLATGLFVLGEKKALELAERDNLAIYMIVKTDKGFVTRTSSAFDKLLKTKQK